MELRSIRTLQTPDQIPLEMELAGVGSRVFAFLVDLFWMGIGFLILMAGVFGFLKAHYELGKTALNLVLFGTLILAFLYHFFQEWLWNGQTVGKRALNIRVVRQDGQAIGFWESFGRNILRFLDVYFAGVGLYPMLLSRNEKRFGDFLVGTLVVNQQKHQQPFPLMQCLLSNSIEDLGQTPLLTRRLDLGEYAVLADYLKRRESLLKGSQDILDESFKGYFQERLNLTPEETQDADFLKRLSLEMFGEVPR
jgi:uncharacterized RDD family membrane protein YckC